MVAVAIGGAAILGAGTSIVEGNKASKTAKQTAASNNAVQEDIYNQNKAALAPFEGAGAPATNEINGLLGIGGDGANAAKALQTWRNSTGYQDTLKTGQNSVTAALGAKGLTDSGAALKALTRFGQNYADQNQQTYIGDLQGQQQTGLTAAAAQAGVGENYAGSVGANNNTAANASENASLNTGNAINSVLGNALSAYTFNQALGSSYGAGIPKIPALNAYGISGSGGIY